MTHARDRLVYAHLALGLLIIPFGLGRLDEGDFLIRLPAILVVALDAGTAFVIARNFHTGIWPHRRAFPPHVLRNLLTPGWAWLAAFGYYIICLWVVMAIIATPDERIENPGVALFFLLGFLLVGIYKMKLVRTTYAVAEELASR